ncbi:MAG TPA: hypothetical protein V6C65_03830, partial [Allocoleopsis sp.]
EGGVYACVEQTTDAQALQEQAAALPELIRPVVIHTSLATLPDWLQHQTPDLRFDRMIGRNALMAQFDKARLLQELKPWLRQAGAIVLAETVPYHTQRLYRLLESEWVSSRLYKRWVKAEEALYHNSADPMVNWQVKDLLAISEAVGLKATVQVEQTQTKLQITAQVLDRWFNGGQTRPSYRDHLAQSLTEAEIATLRDTFTRHLLSQTVIWEGTIAFYTLSPT